MGHFHNNFSRFLQLYPICSDYLVFSSDCSNFLEISHYFIVLALLHLLAREGAQLGGDSRA